MRTCLAAVVRGAVTLAMVALAPDASAATVSVGVTAGGTALGQAVVYALPVGGTAPRAAPKPAIVDQVNKEFVPFVLPVQSGASVSFPNKDNIRHHVYSFSASRQFDLKLYSGLAAKPVVFDKPGVVALGCNIHDWMIGYVYVVDSPWFARSDKAGGATLDLPAGEYDIKVWHPWQNAEAGAQRVRIDGGHDVTVTFRIDITTPKPLRPAS